MGGRFKNHKLGKRTTMMVGRIKLLKRRPELATNVWSRISYPVQAGIIAKPPWYDSIARFPPAARMRGGTSHVIEFPEDRLHSLVLKRIPILRLQRHSRGPAKMPLIAESFARRQLKLMNGEKVRGSSEEPKKMKEKEAYKKCLAEFATQIDAFENSLLYKRTDIFEGEEPDDTVGQRASMSPLERRAVRRVRAVVEARKQQLGIDPADSEQDMLEDAVDLEGNPQWEGFRMGTEFVNRENFAMERAMAPDADLDEARRKDRLKKIYAGLRIGPGLLSRETLDELKDVAPFEPTEPSWADKRVEQQYNESIAYLDEMRDQGK